MSRMLRSRNAVIPTLSNSSSDVRSGLIARIGGLEICHASALAGGRATVRHLEARRSSGAPPALEARQPGDIEMALVDERSGDRTRTGVEVLVRAPGGEVDAPVVQRQRHVAGGVGEVPADEGAGGLAGSGDRRDVEQFAGEVVDAAEQHEGD